MNKIIHNKKIMSYIGIFTVVIIWGLCPLITNELNRHYSPTFKVAVSEIILLISFLVISGKNIKKLDKSYIIPGLITGFFLSLANITQKIGLLYTTPAKYAFLENLSCVSVPLVLYFLVKKKATKFTYISVILCLAGVFILNGISFADSWGAGEILCAISGILYGFNIAGTAVYAKKLFAPLYLAVQCIIGLVISLLFAFILNAATITDAAGNVSVIEKIVFSPDVKLFIFLVLYVIISSAFCWIIRTNCLKYIPANVVSVIMPLSAVVTTVASTIAGTDPLSSNIIWGGLLGIIAVLTSSFDK